MPRQLGLAVGLVVLSLAVGPAAAPQRQAPGVFRGGVTVVNVDVYPRRDGRVVEGLRAQDFEVLEDGVPQRIDAFEFIRAEPNTPDADRRDPNTKEEGDELAADPHNRVFVVYLDSYHTSFEAANAARGPLLEFLGHTIGAIDLFGVMTPDTPAGQLVFGRRIDTLQSELTNHFDWGLRGRAVSPLGRPAIEEQLERCGQSVYTGDALVAMNREDVMETGLEQLMVRLRDLRDERKNVVFVSEGWVPLPPQPEFAALASGSIPTFGQGPGGTLGINPQRGLAQPQSWCDQQIVRLASMDFAQRFRDLLTLASRANVSFYTLDLGRLKTGLEVPPRAARPVSGSADALAEAIVARLSVPSTTTLQNLAENTDGRAIVNTNDLGTGLRRIADNLSAYYLLGYSSTNTTLDGKFRRIEVKVNQPKVSVAARRGYVAATTDAGAAASGAAGRVVPSAIAGELGRLSRLRPDAEFFTYGVVRDGGLGVVVEISSDLVARGKWRSGADVTATVPAAGGEVTGRGRIDPGARGVLVDIPIPAGQSGPWRVALRVSDADGALTDRLEVARPDPAETAGALIGVPIAWRGTAASRIPLRPVADFQFRRNERVRVVWPAREALDNRSARVLDRRGDPLAVPVTLTESPGAVNVDVLLAPLAEGDYLIELTAGQGARTDRRVLAFRVIR